MAEVIKVPAEGFSDLLETAMALLLPIDLALKSPCSPRQLREFMGRAN